MSDSDDFENFDDEDISDVEEIEEIDEDIDDEENLEEQEGNIDNIDEDEMEGEFDEEKEDEEDIDVEDELEDEEEEQKEEKKEVNKLTVPFLTKYEYPKIIALRSQQISQRSPIFIDLEELKTRYKKITPIIIAEEEFKQGKLNNIIIKRRLPNGKIEERKLTELKILSFY